MPLSGLAADPDCCDSSLPHLTRALFSLVTGVSPPHFYGALECLIANGMAARRECGDEMGRIQKPEMHKEEEKNDQSEGSVKGKWQEQD